MKQAENFCSRLHRIFAACTRPFSELEQGSRPAPRMMNDRAGTRKMLPYRDEERRQDVIDTKAGDRPHGPRGAYIPSFRMMCIVEISQVPLDVCAEVIGTDH